MRPLLLICSITFLSFNLHSQCIDELWHNSSSNSIWKSCVMKTNPVADIGSSHWITYEFEESQNIESIRIWNIAHPEFSGEGAKKIRIDKSSDGNSWDYVGELDLEIGSSSREYTGEEFLDLNINDARYINLTILENHDGGFCSGFAEVQFKLGEGTTITNDEYLSTLLTITPNPVDDFFRVSLKDLNTDRFDYQLTDMAGRIILFDRLQTSGTNNEVTLDGSALPEGTYSLRLETDHGQIAKKIVVIHPK